jgi:putative iron-regulated protein
MKKYFIFAISAILLQACTPDPVDPNSDTDYSDILLNLTDQVIIPTYDDLYQKSTALMSTLNTLQSSPTAVNLAAAQQAWRDARIPWEQSEGFLYGPVETLGIDPAIDSWPVNQFDLDAVLNSSDALTKAYLDAQEGTIKGFHTLEYLLFGANSNKQIGDFTPRQFEYLSAAAQSLQGACERLRDNWTGGVTNFAHTFKTAGTSGNVAYPSQKSALQEVINGCIVIADEVANGKIYAPFSQEDLMLEESRFSANSKADFADNIRSIKNIYTGLYANASGKGLSEVIKTKNATLDTKVRQQIEDAINAIIAIEGTFTSAIFNAKPSVENAQNKVRTLQETLQNEVYPLIDGL